MSFAPGSAPVPLPIADAAALYSRPLDLIRHAVSRFEQAGLHYGHGTTCALDEAAALVLGALHLPPDMPDLYLQATLAPAERTQVLELIERRVNERLPLPYLLGWCWYAGQRFEVSADTLIPRSPLFEWIAEEGSHWLAQPPRRALDLCTGSGCLAILLAQAFPEAQVDASDISPAALEVAARNVARHGLQEQVRLLQGDGLAACGEARYDLILSNPPYVPAGEYAALPAEYGHEPRLALEAGDDGLDFVRGLLRAAPDYLNEGGLLVCEVGSAAMALDALCTQWPLTWLDFETGGDGVFLISREDLLAALQATEGE